MNPKDIPFATGYIIALYYMAVLLQTLPKPTWKTLLGLTLGITIAFGIRAGGLILVAYLGLFVGLAFLLQYGIQGIWKNSLTMLQYAGLGLIPIIGGLGLGTLSWPYGLTDPINHIPEALEGFTKFAVGIKMLFNGKMIFGNEAPPSYLPTWLLNTLPLYILAGGALFFVLLKRIWQQHTPFYLFMALFGFIFPIIFVIAQGSTLYDGWRHLLFSYPPLVALVAITWNTLFSVFEQQRTLLIGSVAILAALLLEPLTFIVRNPNYPYIYFNPIAGGISGAFGKYETDYWGVSVKQGLDWMEKEGIIGPNMTDTVIIVSNFSDALDKYAKKRYQGKVKTGYVRFRERHNINWNYGLFASRFIPGSYLKEGNWPPSHNTIHAIKANKVPILAIMKSENDLAYRGVQAAKNQDWATAITLLTQEVQQSPSNEVAFAELAKCYMQLNQLPQAKEAAQKTLAIEPENLQAINLLALYHLRANEGAEAEQLLLNSLEFEPRNSVAYYYLGIIEEGRNNLSKALEYAKESVKYNNKFREGYQLAAQIYEKMGDSQNAAVYNQAAAQISGG
ncbi:MAG: tetratricopeptide repeat protein [Saprospiraceae bacterium]|nr:tetratricopeptide repeat protein [Saprospiraceae bacterium]